MKLKFPELNGGQVQGLNDAGVENFQGAIDSYVARECGQNTGDAPRLGVTTVRLEFDCINLLAKEIPAFEELRATLEACRHRWSDKEKEREFFEHALQLSSKDEIRVLKISDYGTSGLTGDDVDEQGRWFALVKSQGVSNKGDTAGGSFGIGKSSPFAASRFRTVLYGTRTETGTVALQGVSRLVSHKNAEGRLTQGTGFLGEYDPAGGEGGEPIFRAVRDEAGIPVSFRRSEPGTDIWVIGYRTGPDWSAELIRSILANFWPAIYRGSIQFRVGETFISQANLADLIQNHIGHEEFEAHHFYKAIANQPIKKSLKHTGACELYLAASNIDLPRKICMVRASGMRIYDYQPKACRVPFSGLFICIDPDGNKLLRKLEPPKHDTWDPKRIDDQSGKKALDEIKLWIREEVKKLNPLFAGNSFNESELAKYIADTDLDDPNDLPNEETGQSEEEALEPRSKQEQPPATPLKAKPVAVEPGVQTGEGGGGNEATETGGNGGGAGSGGGQGAGIGGSGKIDEEKPPIIRVRSYRSGADGRYELVLRSEKDFQGAVRVQAVGEDGHREEVSLLTATTDNNGGKSFSVKGDAILNVGLFANAPLRVSVTLEALERRSLTVVARK